MMIGRNLADRYSSKARTEEIGEVVVEQQDISEVGARVKGVSFEARKGEVLGVAGWVRRRTDGAGPRRFRQPASGRRRCWACRPVCRQSLALPFHCWRAWLSHPGSERRGALHASRSHSHRGGRGSSTLSAPRSVSTADMKRRSPGSRIHNYAIAAIGGGGGCGASGGNQQKVLLGRWWEPVPHRASSSMSRPAASMSERRSNLRIVRQLARNGLANRPWMSSELPRCRPVRSGYRALRGAEDRRAGRP